MSLQIVYFFFLSTSLKSVLNVYAYHCNGHLSFVLSVSPQRKDLFQILTFIYHLNIHMYKISWPLINHFSINLKEKRSGTCVWLKFMKSNEKLSSQMYGYELSKRKKHIQIYEKMAKYDNVKVTAALKNNKYKSAECRLCMQLSFSYLGTGYLMFFS